MGYKYTRVNWNTTNTPLSPMNLNNMDEGISEAFKEIKTLEKNSKEYSDTNILSFSLAYNIDEDVSRTQSFKLPKYVDEDENGEGTVTIDYSKYVPLVTNARYGTTQIITYNEEYSFDNASFDALRLEIDNINHKIIISSTYSTSGSFYMLFIPAAQTKALSTVTD